MPLSSKVVGLVWSINARVFCFGHRQWIFNVPVEDPIDELVAMTIEHFLRGARALLPRLVSQARASAAGNPSPTSR